MSAAGFGPRLLCINNGLVHHRMVFVGQPVLAGDGDVAKIVPLAAWHAAAINKPPASCTGVKVAPRAANRTPLAAPIDH